MYYDDTMARMSYDDLVKEYRQLAKRADQRLVRLEKLSGQENFHTAINWAYAKAQRSIRHWSGEGATRFNVKPPEKVTQIKAKIKDIKTFLEMPTSTKSGIINIYKKRADTLNEHYGTSFSWEDLGSFFENEGTKKLADPDGSPVTVLKAMAVIQSTDDAVIQKIEKNRNENLIVPNKKVQKTVNEILHSKGIDLSKFY